jgi:hypothetical protein
VSTLLKTGLESLKSRFGAAAGPQSWNLPVRVGSPRRLSILNVS